MFAALTGMGLSAAAGLNAFIPFLVVACTARFTNLITLPPTWSWIESWWAIAIGTVLLIVEVVVDKIPAIDSLNDTVQTFVRPGMAGLISAATASASALDNSNLMTENPWIPAVLGMVVAGITHGGKMMARPAINVGTAGVGAPVASTVEDGVSLGASLVAIMAPLLVIGVLIVVLGGAGFLAFRVAKAASGRAVTASPKQD